MGETLSVSIDTSKDAVQPTLEEEASKYDAPPEDNQSDTRPEWLPEKFKSAEDLAKAYTELEKKLGAPKPKDEAKPEAKSEPNKDTSDSEETEPEKAAREAAENAGLNFDDLSAKYWDKGTLDDSDYAALEKSGIPKNIVDQFIAGQEAILNTTRAEVFNSVGGEQTYFAMTEWAAENMSEAEIETFNRAVNSGDKNMAMLAVKGLQAQFSAAEGFEPKRSVSGATAKASANVYRSIAELEKDMGDARYRNDPAFRRDVEQKLARSDIM
jgi:hypothetical protein